MKMNFKLSKTQGLCYNQTAQKAGRASKRFGRLVLEAFFMCETKRSIFMAYLEIVNVKGRERGASGMNAFNVKRETNVQIPLKNC